MSLQSYDDPFWDLEVDFGGSLPRSPRRMREAAYAKLATPVMTSASEAEMARCILWLLERLADARGEEPWPR